MIIKVGIDLGTTNTVVVTEQKGNLKNIKFEGDNNLPSVVYYDDNNNIVVGKKAKQLGVLNPDRRIKSAKTHIGDYNYFWNINGKKINSTMVATEVLKEVKRKVIKKFKLDEDKDEVHAVITVPAYFTSNQKDETKKAAENAGIKPIMIITEPVAAAIAYGLEFESNEKLFIFDLGGGTFDVAVLEIDSTTNDFKTVALDGDKHLGGDDFDKLIYDYFVEIIKQETNLDLNVTPEDEDTRNKFAEIKARLYEEAEKTKISLSETEEVNVQMQYLMTLNDQPYHFKHTITKDDFEKLYKDLYEKIDEIIFRCLNDNKISEKDIDKVILVGGSSNLPFVRRLVKTIFNQEPFDNLDLGNLVAKGAGIYATFQDGIGINLTQLSSHSLGVEVITDEGEFHFSPIIKKNQAYPCVESDIFSTTMDYEDKVNINVYEGEDKLNLDNNEFYGGFELQGIEKEKAGIPQIKVEFSYDIDGILHVTATDVKTGATRTVRMKKGEKVTTSAPIEKADIVLVMDLSGSMYGGRIQEAITAGKTLINDLLNFNFHKLSLVAFANRSETLINLNNNKSTLYNAIDNYIALMNNGRLGGGTYMTSGIQEAISNLQGSNNKKVIILVTDGQDGGNAIPTAEQAINNGIDIYAIGVYGAQKAYLQRLTKYNDRYFMLNNMTQLKNTFKTIINGLKHK